VSTKRSNTPKHLPDFLDLEPRKQTTSFYERVYEIVRQIPKGKVTSYGAIGETLGMKRSARLVGSAMKAVDPDLRIPTHRVVNKSGALTAAHMFGGYEPLRKLLEKEGVKFHDERIDMTKCFWHPREIT
jgi:methylated-DNA-protein-cysteine methyltransferase-like protein